MLNMMMADGATAHDGDFGDEDDNEDVDEYEDYQDEEDDGDVEVALASSAISPSVWSVLLQWGFIGLH